MGSATIRNEMADLEEMGYLEQPHTSAGRIPSSKGYRLYVDKLMETPKLSKEEELRIKEYIINSAMHEVDKILKEACVLLSELNKFNLYSSDTFYEKKLYKITSINKNR